MGFYSFHQCNMDKTNKITWKRSTMNSENNAFHKNCDHTALYHRTIELACNTKCVAQCYNINANNIHIDMLNSNNRHAMHWNITSRELATARTLHNNVTHKKMQISANMQTYMCACALSMWAITRLRSHPHIHLQAHSAALYRYPCCVVDHTNEKCQCSWRTKCFFSNLTKQIFIYFFVRTVAMLTKIVAGDKSAQIDKSQSHACIPIRISQRKCTYAKLPQSMCGTI